MPQVPEDRPPPVHTEADYLLDAEESLNSVLYYDAGDGVTVMVVTPPPGRGPIRYVVLIEGVSVPPPYSNPLDAKRAADRAARRRKPPSGGGQGPKGFGG